MSSLKLLFSFLLISFYSYSQTKSRDNIKPEISRLTNKIVPLVSYINNPDSCIKALSYLDSATNIDTSCFLCYYNKLMFLARLKNYNAAIIAINECIRLSPNAQDLYLTNGMLYRKIGDSLNSTKYFQKSLAICDIVLDTMKSENLDYKMLTANKAINLIMLGNENKGNEILKNLSNNSQDDNQYDSSERKRILSYMNKSKNQIMDIFFDLGN